MEDETAHVTARYEHGRFEIIEYDHVLRPPLLTQDLLLFLAFLTQQNWIAVGASFDGFIVTIELQKTLAADKQMFYTAQELHLSVFSVLQKGLVEDLKQPMLKYGWKELASSAPLGDLVRGMTFITLWSKLMPKLVA